MIEINRRENYIRNKIKTGLYTNKPSKLLAKLVKQNGRQKWNEKIIPLDAVEKKIMREYSV